MAPSSVSLTLPRRRVGAAAKAQMTRPPRPTAADALRPALAERARTVAARPGAAVCAAGLDGCRVLGQAVTADGDVLRVVPTDGQVATALRHARDGDLAALVLVT